VYGASVGAVNACAYAGEPTVDGMKRLEQVGTTSVPTMYSRETGPRPVDVLQQRHRFYANIGLRKVLESGLSIDRIEDATIPVESWPPLVGRGRIGGSRAVRSVDAALASAAIPGVFPPVLINDEPMIDGGVVNTCRSVERSPQGHEDLRFLLWRADPQHTPLSERPIDRSSQLLTSVHFEVRERRWQQLPKGVELIVFSGGETTDR